MTPEDDEQQEQPGAAPPPGVATPVDDEAAYAQQRAAEIARWAVTPPSWVARGFNRSLAPASRAVQALVPVALLRRVLAGSHELSRWQFHQRLPQPQAGANLRDCDRRARGVERTGMSLAAGIGAATGVGGAVGLVADVPALLTLALATIDRTARCYGESEPDPEQERSLGIGIFALASANSVAEKRQALRMLQVEPEALTLAAARDGLERAAQRQLAKDAAQVTLAQLARQLGTRLGQRKLGQALPLLGSAVGLTVNALYLRDVARAAQQVYALRYLLRGAADAPPGHGAVAALRPPRSPLPTPESAGFSAADAAAADAAPESTER